MGFKSKNKSDADYLAEEPIAPDYTAPTATEEPQAHVAQDEAPKQDDAVKALEESRVQKVQGVKVDELEGKSSDDKLKLIRQWRDAHKLYSPGQASWEELDLILGNAPNTTFTQSQPLPHVTGGELPKNAKEPEGDKAKEDAAKAERDANDGSASY